MRWGLRGVWGDFGWCLSWLWELIASGCGVAGASGLCRGRDGYGSLTRVLCFGKWFGDEWSRMRHVDWVS